MKKENLNENILRLLIHPTSCCLPPTWPAKEHMGWSAIPNSEWVNEKEGKRWISLTLVFAHFPYLFPYKSCHCWVVLSLPPASCNSGVLLSQYCKSVMRSPINECIRNLLSSTLFSHADYNDHLSCTWVVYMGTSMFADEINVSTERISRNGCKELFNSAQWKWHGTNIYPVKQVGIRPATVK